MSDPELWPMRVVVEKLGAKDRRSAAKTLHRWGVKAVDREAGVGGENRYRASEIEAHLANRPRRGARRDLQGKGPGEGPKRLTDDEKRRILTLYRTKQGDRHPSISEICHTVGRSATAVNKVIQDAGAVRAPAGTSGRDGH